MIDVKRLFSYVEEKSIKILIISIFILILFIIISIIFAIFGYLLISTLFWFIGLIIFIWLIGMINLYDRVKNIKKIDWLIVLLLDLFSYVSLSIFIGNELPQLIFETIIYMFLVWLYIKYRESFI